MVDTGQQYGNQNSTGNMVYNKAIDASAIRYRLDNDPVLAKLELYLRSSVIVGEEKDGVYTEKVVSVAKALANEAGVQGIMGYLHLTLGAHNVQGNLDWIRYDNIIFEIDEYLSRIVYSNRVNWGISVDTVDLILDSIMSTVQLFLSRTVDNQERISYGQSMTSVERSVQMPMEHKGGILGGLKGLFGGKQ